MLARVTPDDRAGAPHNVEAREYLARLAAGPDLAGLNARTALPHGDVAEGLVAEAGRQGADLIAIATHGRGGLTRLVLGSVAERVLARSPIPVLVLRADESPIARLRTLLVPTDGTAGSATAVAIARDIATMTKARVVLLQVVEPLPRWGQGWEVAPGWEEEARQSAQRFLDWLARGLIGHGVAAKGRAALGAVPRTIAAEATKEGADLIVMATHALTGTRRALLGSVADAVVRTAARPVLLVRQRDGEPAGHTNHDAAREALPDVVAPPDVEPRRH